MTAPAESLLPDEELETLARRLNAIGISVYETVGWKSTRQACDEAAAQLRLIPKLREACMAFRDAVLHNRNHLYFPWPNSDQTDAVLAEYDSTIGTALGPNRETETTP